MIKAIEEQAGIHIDCWLQKGTKPWEEESLWRLSDPAIRKLITKTVTKGKQLHVQGYSLQHYARVKD